MKPVDLTRRLAAQKHVTRAEASDQVDEVVRKILHSLRSGQTVELPGVGRLISQPSERKRPRE
jgi:nucleoid DNA-binding protein